MNEIITFKSHAHHHRILGRLCPTRDRAGSMHADWHLSDCQGPVSTSPATRSHWRWPIDKAQRSVCDTIIRDCYYFTKIFLRVSRKPIHIATLQPVYGITYNICTVPIATQWTIATDRIVVVVPLDIRTTRQSIDGLGGNTRGGTCEYAWNQIDFGRFTVHSLAIQSIVVSIGYFALCYSIYTIL